MAKQLQQSVFNGAPEWVRWASADSFGWLYWTAENPKALTGEIQLLPGQDLQQETASQWAGCEPLRRKSAMTLHAENFRRKLAEINDRVQTRNSGGFVAPHPLKAGQIETYAHALVMSDIDRVCEAFNAPKPSTVRTLEVMKESADQMSRMLAQLIAEAKSK